MPDPQPTMNCFLCGRRAAMPCEHFCVVCLPEVREHQRASDEAFEHARAVLLDQRAKTEQRDSVLLTDATQRLAAAPRTPLAQRGSQRPNPGDPDGE